MHGWDDDVSCAVCCESQPWNKMTHLLARAERGQHDKPMRLESRAVGQCWHLHWHRPGHRLWEIRLGVFVQLQHFNAVKHRSDRRRQRRRRRKRRTQSTSGMRCVRWGPVLLEDTVSTAKPLRSTGRSTSAAYLGSAQR